MKKCPQCGREYDLTMSFCLDDGSELLYGPASDTEPQTAILSEPGAAGASAKGIPSGVGVATGFRATEESESKTAILQPPATAGGSDSSRRFDKRWFFVAVLVAVVALGGFAGYRYFASNSKQIDSIAVMPFVNESGNPDVEYLSDGMTETLIRSLSQLPGLNVKARSSVFRYKGKDTDAKTIGTELGVQAILNGRVIQRGDQLSLNLELIEPRTENVIWAERYDRRSSDLVSLQSDIARDVSQKLSIKLSGADQQKLAKNYTDNAEAYQLYLQGQSYWNKRGLKNIEIAIGKYQQAIDVDPNYALAYAGLADAYAQPSLQPQGMPKALEAARKALSLDNDLAEAHTVYGRLLAAYDYDLSGAEHELLRAIELNPNLGAAHNRYGVLLTFLGKFDLAEKEFQRALELEPLSLGFNFARGQMLINARRYDEAIIQLKKTLELDDTFILTRSTLAIAYELKGDHQESIELLARDAEVKNDPAKAASIRESFAKGGWEGYLRNEISLIKPRPDSGERFGEVRYDLAMDYARLGEKDKAIEALNDAYENREWRLPSIKVNPLFDPLRDDPRFAELLKKVGFPE